MGPGSMYLKQITNRHRTPVISRRTILLFSEQIGHNSFIYLYIKTMQALMRFQPIINYTMPRVLYCTSRLIYWDFEFFALHGTYLPYRTRYNGIVCARDINITHTSYRNMV